MKPQGLEYFVDKVCTVFTAPTNRDFKSENPQTFPQPVFHYFVGKVIEVGSRGVLIEQWNSNKKLKTFFFSEHIVAISEEEILDPSNPRDRELIEDYRKSNESQMRSAKEKVSDDQTSQYLDIKQLTDMSAK